MLSVVCLIDADEASQEIRRAGVVMVTPNGRELWLQEWVKEADPRRRRCFPWDEEDSLRHRSSTWAETTIVRRFGHVLPFQMRTIVRSGAVQGSLRGHLLRAVTEFRLFEWQF